MNESNNKKVVANKLDLKNEFLDLQLEIRRFIDENNTFGLVDLLKDPLVVHSLEDYVNAYKEQADAKRIQKIIKRMLKLKKKNCNISECLAKLEPEKEKTEKIITSECSGDFDFKEGIFTLKSVDRSDKEKSLQSNENMLNLFKEKFKIINSMKRPNLHKPPVVRTFSISSSHSQLLKKLEKTADPVVRPGPIKIGNEITSTASFRNGVLKNTFVDKVGKMHSSPGQPSMESVSPTQVNFIKAVRSSLNPYPEVNVSEILKKREEDREQSSCEE